MHQCLIERLVLHPGGLLYRGAGFFSRDFKIGEGKKHTRIIIANGPRG